MTLNNPDPGGTRAFAFRFTTSMLVRHVVSADVQRLPRGDFAAPSCSSVRAIVFAGTGGREVMRIEERPDPVPGSEEVLVGARFAGINTADLAQRAGAYPPPPGAPQDVPGLEVAGSVIAVGAQVRDFSVGDRVFGLVGGGGLADRVVVHGRHVTRVPGLLQDDEAAAVPEAFITAHDALIIQAGLGVGDVLLVNGANGGVGTAAVQIGVAAGARVFASARTGLERLAALGAEPVAPAAAVGQVQAIGGADVVLELVGAPNLDGDLEVVATKGRIVIVGTGAGAEAALSFRKLMGKRARLFGTVLRARPIEEKAQAVQAFAHDLVPLFDTGRLRAIVDRMFPADEAADAFDHMAGSGKFGKVLLAF